MIEAAIAARTAKGLDPSLGQCAISRSHQAHRVELDGSGREFAPQR